MDLCGSVICRRHHLDGFGVAPFAVGQAFDRQLLATFRVVVSAQEFRELLVSWEDFVVDGLGNLLGQPLLIRVGKARGKLLRRPQKRVCGDNAFALCRQLLEHDLRGHEPILLALAHDLHRLLEHAWNLAQP